MPTDGPISVDDPRVMLPPKQDVYTTIEATIAHFKLVMEGFKPPVGDVYGYTESANGELGFYIVSDGSGTPYRVSDMAGRLCATGLLTAAPGQVDLRALPAGVYVLQTATAVVRLVRL